MFINKIGGGSFNNKAFKGYEHIKDDNGKTVYYFTEPFDGKERHAYLDFYKVKESPKDYHGYVLVPEAGVKTVELDRQTLGAVVDRDELFKLAPGEQIAYRVRVDYEEAKPDTGMQFDAFTGKVVDDKEVWEKFTLLPDTITKPMSRNGLGCLTMVDIHKPGARYEGFESDRTGEIVYDENLQRESEKIKRNSSNKIGGTLAGLEHDIPELRKKGVTTLFVTPIAGGDDLYYHRYHNKNNFQIAEDIGDVDNFASFAKSLFRNGMTYVFDGTFTSEGSEGVNVQYALKWAHQYPDALYRFRLNGIEDGPIGFGFVPKNKENLRYKLVNSPYELAKQDDGKVSVVENTDYDKRKPTYIQAYDASLVTEEQASSKELIRGYASPVSTAKDKLAVNTYQDSVVAQKNQIFDLKNFKVTLDNAADFINSSNGRLEINSPEVALLVAKTPTFEFSQKNRNIALWEDKFGLALRNHGFSGNDEKVLMSIVSDAEREQMRKRIEKGGHQSVDMDVQTVSYWTGLYKDTLTYYIAQTLQDVKTVEGIKKLIERGKLPQEVMLTAQALINIENEDYELSSKGDLERDDATVKALMKLPLASLEFAENTVSVLSQNFFTNLAPNKDLIGKTRFELEQMGNPHLTEDDESVYLKTNKLFMHDIKNFADAVINKMNSQSEEKLIDEYGEYTEYGEYVIEHIGQHIAKYVFLKSLAGNNFIGKYVKTMPNGDIKYNYSAIRNMTTLEDLGIYESDMVSEAAALQNAIQKGMNTLDTRDVEFLANAYLKQLKGSTTLGFRISEAMYEKASLGMDWRIDALKDVKDIDAVKELSDTFDKFWDGVIDYYKNINTAIAEKNPGSKIIGEITDMDATIRRPWGRANVDNFNEMKNAGAKYPNESLAMRDFWIKSGTTTEANYSDFFTSLFRTYAQDYEDGVSGGSIWNVIDNLQRMITRRGVDYMRNLFTFDGNHDKPRVVHFAAMDMSLFHNDFSHKIKVGNSIDENPENNRWAREKAMQILFSVDDISKLPLEIKLNINNLDYFRTVSSQAIAMSNSLKVGIDEVSNINNKDIISDEAKEYFKKMKVHFDKALADLADGKYLDYGVKFNRKTIELDELQDIESVIKAILKTAKENNDLKDVSEETINNWIEWVKGYATNDNLSRYSVQANKPEITSNNIDWIFEGKKGHSLRRDDKEYSAYTAALLAFTKEAFKSACGEDKAHMEAFTKAAISFLNKYDQKCINENSSKFPYSEDPQNADRKNGFGNLEFEETVLMLIEHAEYLAKESKDLAPDEKFEYSEEILRAIYTVIHEPAMAKSIGMAAMLAALVGIPTEFFGDARGQSGGEWKNNNVFNQNRNAIQRFKFEMLKKYRDEIEKNYDLARSVRNVAGAEALNVGTPYMLHFKDNIGAWLMQSKDSMTVTIMTGEGIDNRFRGRRNENISNKLNEIIFPEGLLLEKDTEFECITSKGIIRGIIDHFQYNGQGKWFAKLVGKDGANLLDNETVRNGVSIFKRVSKDVSKSAKNVVMRGRNINQQYNVALPVYNTYNIQAKAVEGQNLSVMSK